MTLLMEQLLGIQPSTIGCTVLDYPTRPRLLPNRDGVRLASDSDKAKLVRTLSKAKGWCFPAWGGPVVVAAGRANDLARRIAYRVGQPVDGKPAAAQEVLPIRRTPVPAPSPSDPALYRPPWVRIASARETRERAAQAVRR